MPTTLEDYIDYFYDPKTGYSAFLKVGNPPYLSVTDASSADEARARVLEKAQEPKRIVKSPR